MKVFLLIFLTLIIISCDSNPHNCYLDRTILERNDSIMRFEDYKTGFTPILEEYKESELEKLNTKSFRLVIRYTWDRSIWIYRFQKNETGGKLTIKKNYTKSYKEYCTNISDTIIRKELSIEKWKEVENIFDANCFWTLPLAIDRRGLDGRTCILEAFDPENQNPINKEYFLAWRWSPEKNTEFRKICDYIESFESDAE